MFVPLDLWWFVELMLKVVLFSFLKTYVQKSLVNIVPSKHSPKIGKPSLEMSVWISLEWIWPFSLIYQPPKWNLWPFWAHELTMKSIDILSPLLLGISKGCKRHTTLSRWALLTCHWWHLITYSSTSRHILGNKNWAEIRTSIQCISKYPAEGASWHSKRVFFYLKQIRYT